MLVVPQTEVRLLNNVPLNSTYEHQLTFADKTTQSSYFIGKSAHTFLDFTYVKEDGSVKVPKGRDSLYACNYIMFRNSDFSSKWFYGFVTKLEYVNPNTTKVHFELDVFQTWQFDFKFNASFVEREHQPRWNADGSPVVNTIDEGLDYGSEYETVSVTQFQPYDQVFFLVIVSTERMDTNGSGITPVLNGAPQPLTYYIHPFKLDGTVPTFQIMGLNINLSPVSDVLKALYTNTKAVNNIASLYVTEYPGIDIPFSNGTFSLPDMSILEHVTVQDTTNSFNTLCLVKKMNYDNKTLNLGSKYSTNVTEGVTESKLLMHPYTVTILSDMKGNHQEIKAEYIKGNDLQLTVKGSLGTSNKVSYNVKNYLMDEATIGSNGSEVAIENGIVNNSPNDVPVITDLLSAYLQGNRNTLENQKNSIAFNQVANLVGSGMGAIGSAMARNPIGAVGGITQMATGTASTYFQLQGLVAKQQDLDTTPSQLSKLGGNTAFDYGNGYRGIYVIEKRVTDQRREILQDYFKMFGYKSNRVKVPNLKSRAHFNFIKTTGANLTGNVPQEDLVVIKKMFDNGVTLWHTSDVGNYSLSNGEV